MNEKNAYLGIYALCLLWCGVLLGVSFIATPAKFLVAELDLATAVKVGRATFQVYHYFELAIASVVCLTLLFFRVEKTIWAYCGLLGLVLAVQYLLVLPLVETNSESLFAGTERQTKSNTHLYYIFCDCLKIVLLLGFLPATSFISKNIDK